MSRTVKPGDLTHLQVNLFHGCMWHTQDFWTGGSVSQNGSLCDYCLNLLPIVCMYVCVYIYLTEGQILSLHVMGWDTWDNTELIKLSCVFQDCAKQLSAPVGTLCLPHCLLYKYHRWESPECRQYLCFHNMLTHTKMEEKSHLSANIFYEGDNGMIH